MARGPCTKGADHEIADEDRSHGDADALQALLAFGKTAENGSVPVKTIQLVQLRASQIDGCNVCVDMHYRENWDERALAALLVAIGTINVSNRLNVATKQVRSDGSLRPRGEPSG